MDEPKANNGMMAERTTPHDDRTLRRYIRDVLEAGTLMSIATTDAAGIWVCDVNYVSDDALNIYWVSNLDARHSAAIEKNPVIAGTITVSSRDEDDLGIQFTGRAERLGGPRRELIELQYQKRRKPIPRERVDIRKAASWYMLRPTVIELIHEKYFGYEKQKLILPTT